MSNLRASLLGCIDKVLEVRDCIGAVIHEVYIINRVWTGERVGDGSFSDDSTQVLPSPNIRDYSHDVRVTNIGAVKAGDLVLIGISRNKYQNDLELRTDTEERNTERLYKVGKHFYRLVHIKENLLTWDIHIRKIRQDETEER